MVKEKSLTESIQNNFARYAGSVILDRAICDARDMLKPAARMLIYSQLKTTKNTYDKPFVKSARVVGDCLGHWYVHGDSSCYGTYMRMAKPYAMRYPLEECQGNSGTIIATGDEAASRYTELKLSKSSHYLYDTLSKNTIDKWNTNFDDTEKFPTVFPSIGYYNIVNGTTGIGVSISSSIPQFNIREVNEAIIKLINNPEEDFDNIICYPDFATGGVLLNKDEVKESLRNGTGKACRIRAVMNYNPEDNTIHVTEMPYGVYTSTITEQIKNLLEEEPNYGIENIIDASGKTPDYTIYLSKGANPKKMMEKLYKDTSLENFFGINMIMLRDGRFPQVFGWREALLSHINHAKDCHRKEIEYDRDVLLARQNIIEGLLTAMANIDDVVYIIRHADDTAHAKLSLKERYNFNDKQVNAILELKLQRLVKLDGIKLTNEHDSNKIKIDELNLLLNDTSSFNQDLISIYSKVANEFGDARRTRVINLVEEEESNSIPEQDCVVFVLSNNNIRIIPADELNGARRGRKGSSIKLPKNVVISNTLYTTNHGKIGTITKNGKIHFFDIDKLNIGEDYSIYELVALEPNDSIVKIINCNDFDYFKYVLFVTKNGMIKLTPVSEYNSRASKGVIAIKLREGDNVVDCFLSNNNERIMIASNSGYYNFYSLGLNPVGRASIGVKAIGLKEGEYVIGATIISNSIEYNGILTINNNGRGKITKLEDFSSTSRGARGYVIQKIEEGESISAIQAIRADSTKVNVIAGNKLTSMAVSEIPSQGRVTSGVSLINAKGVNTNIYIIQE